MHACRGRGWVVSYKLVVCIYTYMYDMIWCDDCKRIQTRSVYFLNLSIIIGLHCSNTNQIKLNCVLAGIAQCLKFE